MSSFKEKLSKSGQSVLDARAQNLYELTKIEEEEFPADATESINLDDVKGDITNPLDN